MDLVLEFLLLGHKNTDCLHLNLFKKSQEQLHYNQIFIKLAVIRLNVQRVVGLIHEALRLGNTALQRQS